MKPGQESRPKHRPLLVPSRDFSRSGEIMVWDRVVSTAQKSQNGRRVRTTPIKAGWFDNILVFVDVEGDAKMGAECSTPWIHRGSERRRIPSDLSHAIISNFRINPSIY